MTPLEACILGIIQGITEFLPVSSSGHLALAQYFLGFENLDHYILFDLVCHLGTLTAIFLVFAPQIRRLFFEDRQKLYQIIFGTLPLFPLLLILKPVEKMFDETRFLGFFFLLTAFLLFAGIRWGRSVPVQQLQKRWRRDAITVGVFQALAILPGVSRSGSTISGARLLGWSAQDAVTFSFLLAIPAILGGTALKLLQLVWNGGAAGPSLGALPYLSGFLSSLVIGYGALFLLIKLATKDKFMYFVWYCLLLGVVTTWHFYLS